MSTRWMAMQILSIKRLAEPARIARNPRPVGVMLPGSASEAVWQYLLRRREIGGGYVQRRQIVAATGRSGKAVDWALIFLRETGRVEATQDSRCTRYLRYRAREGVDGG